VLQEVDDFCEILKKLFTGTGNKNFVKGSKIHALCLRLIDDYKLVVDDYYEIRFQLLKNMERMFGPSVAKPDKLILIMEVCLKVYLSEC
jgi:hypothetical protein